MRSESDHLGPPVQDAGLNGICGGLLPLEGRLKPLFVFVETYYGARHAMRKAQGSHMKTQRYWLMKSEPDVFGIDDLAKAKRKTAAWWGVRNYQARNFMRDDMQLGDEAFFYHSSCAEPGIAGIVTVAKLAYPDATQFDHDSEYFDPAATPVEPRWWNVDVKLVRKTHFVTLKELRRYPELSSMRLLQKANRLSITPVQPGEWKFILGLLDRPAQKTD